MAGGHFHATAIPGGDYAFATCFDSHGSARDGRSIIACVNDSWSYFVFKKANLPPAIIMHEGGRPRVPIFTLNGMEGIMLPFRCKSWRCPKCRPWVFKRDFSRIMTALESRKRWAVAVLTVNQKKWISGKASSYDNLWRPCQRLRQRLTRVLGEMVEYVSIVEQHLEGWPHVNYALTWRTLEEMDAENVADYLAKVERWLKDNAPECGIGYEVYCKPMASMKAIARYFTDKSLGQLGNGPGEADPDNAAALKRLTAEINKTGQLPLEAPLGFRRIRATHGLLPAIRKGNGEWSGCIYDPSKDPEKGGLGRRGAPVQAARSDVARGARGAAPPEGRPPAKRAARRKIEHFTVTGSGWRVRDVASPASRPGAGPSVYVLRKRRRPGNAVEPEFRQGCAN